MTKKHGKMPTSIHLSVQITDTLVALENLCPSNMHPYQCHVRCYYVEKLGGLLAAFLLLERKYGGKEHAKRRLLYHQELVTKDNQPTTAT